MNISQNAIVICTERMFEWKSRLLVRSIRAFGGAHSSVRIFSYSPRPDHVPSRDCLDEFRESGVQVVTESLNLAWPEYALANKVVACAHAERHCGLKKIAFIDSDQIVVSDFGLLFDTPAAFAARPVDLKNIGIANPGDEEGQYWDELYRTCSSKLERTVETTVCRSQIREYFDSGMFSVHGNARILGAWRRNFAAIWTAGLRPKAGDYFVEQSCLSATISAVADEVLILPPGYNLPLESLYRQSVLSTGSSVPGRATVSLHYHRLFEDEPVDDVLAFAGMYLDRERSSWIRSNLNELCPVFSYRPVPATHLSLAGLPVRQ